MGSRAGIPFFRYCDVARDCLLEVQARSSYEQV